MFRGDADKMRRLREFLSQWGMWTSSELAQVADFIDGETADLRRRLDKAEETVAGYLVERERLDVETTRIQGVSEASKHLYESAFDTAIRLLRDLSSSMLPLPGTIVLRAGSTGFSLEPAKVEEHSADGKLFRCDERDVWFGLASEWTGPFNERRPFGKTWRRLSGAEQLKIAGMCYSEMKPLARAPLLLRAEEWNVRQRLANRGQASKDSGTHCTCPVDGHSPECPEHPDNVD